MVAMSFAFSVLEIATGLMPVFWMFALALIPTGLTMLTYTTASNSTTQLNTSAEMRGRVMGLYMMIFLGGTPLGSPLAGWIAEEFGPRMSMIFGGVISVTATMAVICLLARMRGTHIRSYLRPAELARIVA
jgi:MFS family permease